MRARSITSEQRAIQIALADLILEIDPDVCARIAVGCLRLAAAAVVLRDARRKSPRDAASELMLLLADGAPSLSRMAAVVV